jgi:hypothetical protein
MQALLAPILAGGAGAAAAGAGVAATAAAITPMTLALGAIGPIAQGMSAMNQAKSAKEQAKVNSFIGVTRARQTDTAAREGLNSELSNVRAVLSANGQRPNVGTMGIFDELRASRETARRVGFNNEMQGAAGYKAQAGSIKPGMGLASGLIKAGPSLFDLYQWGKS